MRKVVIIGATAISLIRLLTIVDDYEVTVPTLEAKGHYETGAVDLYRRPDAYKEISLVEGIIVDESIVKRYGHIQLTNWLTNWSVYWGYQPHYFGWCMDDAL